MGILFHTAFLTPSILTGSVIYEVFQSFSEYFIFLDGTGAYWRNSVVFSVSLILGIEEFDTGGTGIYLVLVALGILRAVLACT